MVTGYSCTKIPCRIIFLMQWECKWKWKRLQWQIVKDEGGGWRKGETRLISYTWFLSTIVLRIKYILKAVQINEYKGNACKYCIPAVGWNFGKINSSKMTHISTTATKRMLSGYETNFGIYEQCKCFNKSGWSSNNNTKSYCYLQWVRKGKEQIKSFQTVNLCQITWCANILVLLLWHSTF